MKGERNPNEGPREPDEGPEKPNEGPIVAIISTDAEDPPQRTGLHALICGFYRRLLVVAAGDQFPRTLPSVVISTV
jgi:hypothetical protein